MMKTTYLTLVLGLLVTASFGQSPSLLTELQTRLTNAKRYTLTTADRMPEANYGYQPTPEEMTFRAQTVHIAQNLTWLTSSYLTQTPSPLSAVSLKATNQTKADALQLVTQAYDYAIEAIRLFDPAHLDDTVQFFAGPLTKRQIMLLIADHQTHHRAQLLVYLRLNGIKPPDYVGW